MCRIKCGHNLSLLHCEMSLLSLKNCNLHVKNEFRIVHKLNMLKVKKGDLQIEETRSVLSLGTAKIISMSRSGNVHYT